MPSLSTNQRSVILPFIDKKKYQWPKTSTLQENRIDSQLKKKELLEDQNSVMTKLLLILTTRK